MATSSMFPIVDVTEILNEDDFLDQFTAQELMDTIADEQVPDLLDAFLDSVNSVSPEKPYSPGELSELSPSCSSSSSSSEEASFSCPICGNKAGKHHYYGARCCHSCRTFFRRSVKNGHYCDFKCRQNESCVINSKSWKSCQKCRFDKCLQAGMKPSYVIVDRQEKPAKLPKRQRRVKFNSEDLQRALTPLRRGPCSLFSEDERLVVQKLYDDTVTEVLKKVLNMHASNNMEYIYLYVTLFLDGRTMKPEICFDMERKEVLCTQEHFLEQDYFNRLNSEDLNKLICSNMPMAAEFFMSACFSQPSVLIMFLRKFLEEVSIMAGSDIRLAVVEETFKSMNLEDKMGDPKASYDSYYGKLPFSHEESERHRQLMSRMGELAMDEKGKSYDTIGAMLVYLMLLLSPTGHNLKDKAQVDQLQTQHAYMLHRYLKDRYPKTRQIVSKKFCDAMAIEAIAKECLNMKNKALELEMQSQAVVLNQEG